MRNLANLFKALSEETRLTMLALLLRRGELCVCDFVQVLGITQSKASRHLRYMLHAGLIRDRREGVWVHYRVGPKEGSEASEVLCVVAPMLAGKNLGDLERRLEDWEVIKRAQGCQVANQQAQLGGPRATTGRERTPTRGPRVETGAG